MQSSDKIFGNLFSDPEITPPRLTDFGQDALNKFIAAGSAGEKPPPVNPYQAIIDKVQPPLATLQTQLSNVDTSLLKQRGATLTNDEVLADVQDVMRTQEGVIANAVGGFKSGGYIRFYPHGLMEYTRAKKPDMPMLVKRISDAAKDYAGDLGDTLTQKLQGFEDEWKKSRDTQQQQTGMVSDNRTERTQAETDLQLALTFGVHATGMMFPGDVVQCSSFFDFSLLFAHGHRHKAEMFTGNVAKNATAVALNRSFTATTEMKLTCTVNNADLLAYTGATADALPNGKGVKVNADNSRHLKVSELGDEGNTFLLIKNLSDVNDAGYILEVKG